MQILFIVHPRTISVSLTLSIGVSRLSLRVRFILFHYLRRAFPLFASRPTLPCPSPLLYNVSLEPLPPPLSSSFPSERVRLQGIGVLAYIYWSTRNASSPLTLCRPRVRKESLPSPRSVFRAGNLQFGSEERVTMAVYTVAPRGNSCPLLGTAKETKG